MNVLRLLVALFTICGINIVIPLEIKAQETREAVDLSDTVSVLQSLTGGEREDSNVRGIEEAVHTLQTLMSGEAGKPVSLTKRSSLRDFRDVPKLTVGSARISPGNSGTVNITVDNSVGITGAAFTLTYDTSALDITVTSNFFLTFAEMGFGPDEEPDPDSKVHRDDRSVITNEVPGTGMMLAAANATAADGTNNILFTLHITVKETAAECAYDINIIPTTLTNMGAAGYPEDTQIDLLIEAKDDGSFVTLLTADEAAENITSGTITTCFENPFVDGVVDIYDILFVVQIILEGGVDEQTYSTADINGDGVVDITDVLSIIDVMY
jgi:hypothetical protein